MTYERTWDGDWHARVLERVRQRGFASVTEYASNRLGIPLLVLAEELGSGDIAAVQIRCLLIEEASQSMTFPRMARDLLARELPQVLPGGWKPPLDEQTRSEVAGILSGWYAELQDYLDRSATILASQEFLNADLPVGWLPQGPDDPVIIALVNRCLGHVPS